MGQLCHQLRLKALLTRFYSHLCFYIPIESSTEIWSHRTYWLARMDRLLNLLILVLLELLGSQSKLIRMRLWLCGIDVLKSFFHRNTIRLGLICGVLDVFLLKWLKRDHFLWEIVKSIRFSKYSKYLEHQMKTIGQMRSNFRISNHLSQSSAEFQCKSIHRLWTSLK